MYCHVQSPLHRGDALLASQVHFAHVRGYSFLLHTTLLLSLFGGTLKHQYCDVKFEHSVVSGEITESEVHGLPSEKHTSVSKGHLILDLKLLYLNQVLLKLDVQGLIFHVLVLDILENLLILLMHMVPVMHMAYYLLVRISWHLTMATCTASKCIALTSDHHVTIPVTTWDQTTRHTTCSFNETYLTTCTNCYRFLQT